MSRMVEVVIDSVRVSLTNQQRIVVLRETNSERYLPIWIGPYEAESITIALQEIEVARPQTHDLLRNIITQLNGRLTRVEVVSLNDDVFYGNLVIEVNGQTLKVDSRPSDALALAVRAHVPILVAREVMETAGIVPEQDLASQEAAPQQSEELDPGAEERLSVFEDFLQNLNIEDEEDEDDDDEAPGPGRPRKKR
ncbi:MAG TPA: bifunctional nuclease family protein [Anaerolineaceae bacterium]|nr:bifunctional nuclease family protein [Anaerolineaceae bacterium]